MQPALDPVAASNDLALVARGFVASGESHLPVLDATGPFLGILAAHAVMDALAAGEMTDVGTLVSPVEPVAADAPVGDVLRLLDRGAGAVAVTGPLDELRGWIRHRDFLAVLAPQALTPVGTTA